MVLACRSHMPDNTKINIYMQRHDGGTSHHVDDDVKNVNVMLEEYYIKQQHYINIPAEY